MDTVSQSPASEIPAGVAGAVSTDLDVSSHNSGDHLGTSDRLFLWAPCGYCRMARMALNQTEKVRVPLIDRIRPLWPQLLTNQEIANIVGVSLKKLKLVATEHGLPDRPPMAVARIRRALARKRAA